MSENASEFKKSLGLLDATMLVAGSMIGSGIFIVSSDIARNTGSVGWLMVVWLIAGFMTLTAALSYGELSAMFPRAGGQYVYLKEAYNPLVSFTFGWTFFAVIHTATIAAVGVAFSKFTAYLFPILDEDVIFWSIGSYEVSYAQLLAIAVIFLLTFINTKGVQNGKSVQTVITILKLLSLILLVGFGFWAFDSAVWQQNWASAETWHLQSISKDWSRSDYTFISGLGALSAALVGALFSSDSWHTSSAVAGEIKNPKRNIGLSLALGTIIVTVVYLLTNLMYTGVLSLDQMASAPKDRVAMVAAQEIFGPVGITILAVMIMLSTFGCNNGLILAGARIYYSMAQDGLFFKKTGKLNKNAVPAYALWLQGIVAALWCLTGRYGDLLDMITCVVVIFYMLCIIGVFILRKKRPDLPRPYKAFGYPFLPAIYIVMGLLFIGLLVVYKPQFTLPGIGITLAGIPLYYLIKKNNKIA
ncbi:APC family permease [Sphingobacterium corticis]|uniref:APC family permease n=1 Tax=Sphingobacterium corticis TaxID=1812823 RepID=A0ABW5NL32_9SPHI